MSKIRFDENTEFRLRGAHDIDDFHLRDLEFVLDVTLDADRVERCEIDLDRLINAMVLYSSTERTRFDWRRQGQ